MISITFDEESKSYTPNETVSGTVLWSKLTNTERLETRLIWFTQGKGDRDFAIVESISIPVSNEAGKARFQFSAPTRPFSFSGKLISLVWAVEVVQFPSKDGFKETIVLSLIHI